MLTSATSTNLIVSMIEPDHGFKYQALLAACGGTFRDTRKSSVSHVSGPCCLLSSLEGLRIAYKVITVSRTGRVFSYPLILGFSRKLVPLLPSPRGFQELRSSSMESQTLPVLNAYPVRISSLTNSQNCIYWMPTALRLCCSRRLNWQPYHVLAMVF